MSTTISTSEFSIGESIVFQSDVLQQTRTINVYLPLSYSEEPDKKYPVVYLLDGSADEDFIHIAGLVQFGSFSWIRMIPESIVIGIANTDRKQDFTFPSNNEQDRADIPAAGGSSKIVEMLEEELQPLVAQRYRISDSSTLIGQSLGGLLATEILLKKPELFNNYVIVSPSLWWDDESLLEVSVPDLSSINAIYIGVGEEGPTMKRVAKDLFEKLQEDKPMEQNLSFQYFPELDHGDTLHLAVYDAFKTIFVTQ
jgi:predicted alpha/beta superfamily hydrolase